MVRDKHSYFVLILQRSLPITIAAAAHLIHPGNLYVIYLVCVRVYEFSIVLVPGANTGFRSRLFIFHAITYLYDSVVLQSLLCHLFMVLQFQHHLHIHHALYISFVIMGFHFLTVEHFVSDFVLYEWYWSRFSPGSSHSSLFFGIMDINNPYIKCI